MLKWLTFRCVPALQTVHASHFHSQSAITGLFESCKGNDTNIEIRACRTHRDFDECVRMQQRIWKFDALDALPRRAFLVTTDVGGVVIGAFESHPTKSVLVGFAWALLGKYPEGKRGLSLHWEMLAVDPEAENRQIGQQLFLALRDYALSQDINMITGHFDPTDSKLAHLYINRIGCIGRRYTVDYYGQSSSPRQKKLPTDRLHAEIWIESLHRQQQGNVYKNLFSSQSEHIEEVQLPVEMTSWKDAGDPRATKAQKDICNKLTAAFKQGRAIFGYRREPDGSSAYQLASYTLIKQAKINYNCSVNE